MPAKRDDLSRFMPNTHAVPSFSCYRKAKHLRRFYKKNNHLHLSVPSVLYNPLHTPIAVVRSLLFSQIKDRSKLSTLCILLFFFYFFLDVHVCLVATNTCGLFALHDHQIKQPQKRSNFELPSPFCIPLHKTNLTQMAAWRSCPTSDNGSRGQE